MEQNKDKQDLQKKDFKSWLEILQQESWQLELIISGIALFGIWEARVGLGGLQDFLQVHNSSGFQSFFSFLLIKGLTVSWSLLFINLIIHIISRGIWIGAIGLRYVSGDIDFAALQYAPIFSNFLARKTGRFDDYIAKLERFSSILFAYTFLLTCLTISFVISISIFFAVVSSLSKNESYFTLGIFSIVFLLASLIVLIDFVSLGSIKKVQDKTVSFIYFWVFRLFSLFTFSFLYRSILYNFLDHPYARKFFLFSLPYVLLVGLLPSTIIDPTPFFPMRDYHHLHDYDQLGDLVFYSPYYDDERTIMDQNRFNLFKTTTPIQSISLPSKILSSNYGSFFLESRRSDSRFFKEQKKISPYSKEGWMHGIRSSGKNREKDKKIEALEQQRDSILKKHILRKVKAIKQVKSKQLDTLIQGTILKNDTILLDSLFWKNERDSIEDSWELKIDSSKIEKAYSLLDAMLELNEIKIDQRPFNDSLICKFYLHPNLGERGLQCYFPLHTLKEGIHELHLTRKYYRRSLDTTLTTDEITIPFMTLENFQK